MAKWYILIIAFIYLFMTFLMNPVEAATTTTDFKERYYDWDGKVYDFNAINLEAHPLYVVVDNGDNWGIVRDNKTVYLPKRPWIEYKFYPERIVPVYHIDSFSQINGLVTKVSPSVWYLTVPFSANYYVSVTDDLIDFGVFKRTTRITVSDSNTTACGFFGNISCPDYRVVPKVVNNDIRLYFNPQNFSGVVYPLYLTENTITVDNSTFWSSQDCGDGYWSAYGGGSCATPLNSSIHANLSGYWDMESTSGTTEYGINRFGRFPNSSIAGTWNGNTTLNYTTGQNWGNTVLFDGINDYIQIPDSNAFTFPAGSKATWSLIQYNNNSSSSSSTVISKYEVASYEWVSIYLSSSLYFWVYDASRGTYRGRYAPAPSNKTFHKTQFTYDGGVVPTSVAIYTDDVKSDTNDFTSGGIFDTMYNTASNLGIAKSSPAITGIFNGSIDEYFIVASGSPVYSNSTYSTKWNKTFSVSVSGVVSSVKFNIYNVNVQNNSANISVRQDGTTTWTQIATNYSGDNTTWINGTWWQNTDFAVNMSGNGSSRAFIISMSYNETTSETVEITGYVNNTLGAFVDGALVTIDNASTLSRHTYLVDNTDLCNYNHTSLQCDGTRQSNTTYNASTNLQLMVFAHANNVSQTAEIIVNIDGTNVTYTSGRPLGGAEESYKQTVILVPKYANYTVYFSNYHHYEWREYPLVHGYYNLTSETGIQSVLAQQVGYANFTSTLNASADMSYNITLSEKETVSEATVIDYSLVGAMLGGLLAFVLLRRIKKDDR